MRDNYWLQNTKFLNSSLSILHGENNCSLNTPCLFQHYCFFWPSIPPKDYICYMQLLPCFLLLVRHSGHAFLFEVTAVCFFFFFLIFVLNVLQYCSSFFFTVMFILFICLLYLLNACQLNFISLLLYSYIDFSFLLSCLEYLHTYFIITLSSKCIKYILFMLNITCSRQQPYLKY